MKNFEKFKQSNERMAEFEKYCKAHNKCDGCVLVSHKSYTLASCALAWLDLEAHEETQMDCPYCGRPILGTRGTPMTVRFVCDCGYSSRECHTIEEAIAAHNRICRAVKAANKESEVK